MTDTPATSRAGLKKQLPERFRGHRGVWVFVEIERGRVHPVSFELIGEGRRLADALGVDLAGVVMGPKGEGTTRAVAEAFAHGVDLVHLIEDDLLADYRNQPFAKGLTDLVEAREPEILLLGATPLGRDLAGAVATTLKTGLTADCTELAIDADRSLAATRPTFGGSLLCTIYTLNHRPQMATVRPRVMKMPERRDRPIGPVIVHPLGMGEEDVVTRILGFVPDRDTGEADLAYADIVVAGGLGLGAVENLQLVKTLAAAIGAEWGGSRPLVQKGWMAADRQIGQTGKTVRPRLYIAAGISGAVQHRVGVEGADLIVAINTDRDAPIFDFAHVGIVTDAVRFLPALTEAFRRRLSPHARDRLAG